MLQVIITKAMKKAVTLILTFCIISSFSHGNPIATQPQAKESFNMNQITPQQVQATDCSYTVIIKTSCSSPPYTEDQISIAFTDAYGYQVYAPKLDHLYPGTFERCSETTFEIQGPCTDQICQLYLYRTGYDGWIPESVTVSGYLAKPVLFHYNIGVPYGLWYGFNNCKGNSVPFIPYKTSLN